MRIGRIQLPLNFPAEWAARCQPLRLQLPFLSAQIVAVSLHFLLVDWAWHLGRGIRRGQRLGQLVNRDGLAQDRRKPVGR